MMNQLQIVIAEHPAAIQFFIGALIILAAFIFIEERIKSLFWVLFGIGSFLFARGIITTAMIQGWIVKIPDIIQKIFVIFQ